MKRRMAVFVALQPALLFLAGCLTIGLVNEAQGNFPHYARITAIHGAVLHEDDVVVRVGVRRRGRGDTHDLLFRIPGEQIGTYKREQGSSSYQHGDLKLAPAAVGCIEPVDALPEVSSALLPIQQITVRDLEGLDKFLPELPVGTHILAVRFDWKLEKTRVDHVGTGDVLLDKGTMMALVQRPADAPARSQFVWGFEEQRRERGALLLLAPLTLAGDVVTLPLQIIAVLIGGC